MMEALSTSLNSTINIPLQIKGPKGSEILLYNNIIIQEQHFVEIWEDLWQIKSKMIEEKSILGSGTSNLNQNWLDEL